jgi:membrane protease YdiL (CAAX protease family)
MLLVVGTILEFGISRGVFAVFGSPSTGTSVVAVATTPRPPPVIATLGLLALPLSAGVAEELIYRAYALPRLWVLARRWPGMFLMAFGFGLGHATVLSWSDWRIALARGLVLFVMGLIMGTLYLKRKRIVPLMVAHTLHDYLGLLLAGSLLTIW